MEKIYLTEDEFNVAKEIGESLNANFRDIGRLTQQIDILKKQRQDILNRTDKSEVSNKEFFAQIHRKYGAVDINLENGEIIPKTTND
jgi:hypothetical protein